MSWYNSHRYGTSQTRSNNTQPKRCTKEFSLTKQSTSTSGSYYSSSSITLPTESDLLKYEDLNMDLKEINEILKDLEKKKKTRNNNISKARSKKKNTNINSKVRNIEAEFSRNSTEFAKRINKILSEKIKAKVIFRLDRLINHPKESRLNKVACALRALFEILKSCNTSGNSRIRNEAELITAYQNKVAAEYKEGASAAAEFIKDILYTNNLGIADFISKEKLHQGSLGSKLKTVINEIPTCSA